MKNASLAAFATALVLAAAACHAGAGDVVETLSIAWEAYWNQSGYPQPVSKWQGPIRVKFTGDEVPRNKDFALSQLHVAADVAGIEVVEVAADDASANFEVEFLANMRQLTANESCHTNYYNRNGTINRAKIRANEPRVWFCMLHETMHAMGFDGHPHAGSVLTYFARSGGLTAADIFLLKTVYSSDIKPGMTPLAALAVFARRLLETVPPGTERTDAEQAVQAFLLDTVRQAETFADGGEPLAILLRSGKSTSAGIARGRIETQYFLGIAYTFGHVVAADPEKGVTWLTRCAQADRMNAQFYLGQAYAKGRGVAADPVEAYKWYALAGSHDHIAAKKELETLEARLPPEQIALGKTRAEEWRQSRSSGEAK